MIDAKLNARYFAPEKSDWIVYVFTNSIYAPPERIELDYLVDFVRREYGYTPDKDSSFCFDGVFADIEIVPTIRNADSMWIEFTQL